MITRPLDLASKLRPPPRSLDALHFVNVLALGLFFFLFGSRFVLAPGLGLNFELPQLIGANAAAAQTTHAINVQPSGLVFTGDAGLLDANSLRVWLNREAEKTRKKKTPSLLIIAEKGVSLEILTRINGAAHDAGFQVQLAARDTGQAEPSR